MLYIILMALWPAVNFLSTNFMRLGFLHLDTWGGIAQIVLVPCFACVIAVHLAAKIFKKPFDFFILPMFILVSGFFLYAPIVEDIIGDVSKWHIKASYIWLLVYVGALVLSLLISKNAKVVSVSKVIVPVVFLVAVSSVGSNWYRTLCQNAVVDQSDRAKEDNNIRNYVFKHKPNVYYILVDAYARQDTLKEVCNFDNEPFLKELEQLGFAVSRTAHSNYHFTAASLSATMNMDYHEVSKTSDGEVVHLEQMYKSLSGDNPVRRIFRDNGYKIIDYPAHWEEAIPINADKCIRVSTRELFLKMLESTPFRFYLYKHQRYVNIEGIVDALEFYKDFPKFIFVHLAHVHDAIYNKEGQQKESKYAIISGPSDSVRYASSVNVVNGRLLRTVKSILRRDPGVIIIIQADHGPTYVGDQTPADSVYWLNKKIQPKSKRGIRYAFGIISAVYVSRELLNDESNYDLYKYFSGTFSLINVFRKIFSVLSCTLSETLEDKFIYLYRDSNWGFYKIFDVSKLN